MSPSPKCPILLHHSQSAKPGVLVPGQSNQDSKGFGPESWRRGTLDGQPRGLGEGRKNVLPASSLYPHHRYTVF